MSRETWRPVPSAPGWIASSEGRVAMLARLVEMPNGGFKILEVRPTKGQFRKDTQRYSQSVNGRTRRVATMVCEAFNGPRPSMSHECMHLDEDSTNDCPDNLAWGTRSENMSAPLLQASRAKRLRDRHPRRKLTDDQVREIRASRGNTSLRQLADRYGISPEYARHVAAGRERREVHSG